MARRNTYDHAQDIERALGTAWRADITSQTSTEVAKATGLSVGQVQSTGRRFFSQRDKGERHVIEAEDFDGARVKIRIHYLRGTFMMEPEQGWSGYWVSKRDTEEAG